MADYVALLEVEPSAECELLAPDAIGAMARCYVVAASEDEARRRIAEGLHEEGLRVVEYDWLVDNAEVDWDNPDDSEGLECSTEARTTGALVIGRLDSWSSEE